MLLDSAIENVYRAFSDVAKPVFVDGCPCCMTANEYETLTGKPLRELDPSELNKYGSAAMLTMGSEQDYQYFLPRILELTVEDDVEWTADLETTANKMHLAGYSGWTAEKRLALEHLWLTVIREFAAKSKDDPEMLGFASWDIQTWMGAATLVPISVSQFLEFLESYPDVVREIYKINFKTIFQGRLDNPFLSEPSQGQIEIANWLRHRIEPG
jgi:hypothetical protein